MEKLKKEQRNPGRRTRIETHGNLYIYIYIHIYIFPFFICQFPFSFVECQFYFCPKQIQTKFNNENANKLKHNTRYSKQLNYLLHWMRKHWSLFGLPFLFFIFLNFDLFMNLNRRRWFASSSQQLPTLSFFWMKLFFIA